MEILREIFGKNEDGRDIYKYIVNGENISAAFCETGASIMSLKVQDADGKFRDVVLGLDSYEDYRRNWPAFGSVIGRCANRVKNAKFTLNGQKYKLKKNIPGGCLHSGFSYQYRDWFSNSFEDEEGAHIVFSLKSEDGDQGFPGNLDVSVEYIVTETKTLVLRYKYLSDADTVVNMTNHCYFNLNGHESGTAMNHRLKINALKVTQFDKKLMPTGELCDVLGTAFDFTEQTAVCENALKTFKPLAQENEYDMNYVISDKFGEYKLAAEAEGDLSKICMRVYTNMPGMQFYTANAVNGFRGKGGVKYSKNPALCFETQFYPDAVNIASFPSPVIKAYTETTTETKFEFSICK